MCSKVNLPAYKAGHQKGNPNQKFLSEMDSRFVEKVFLFDIFVVFIYIVVQTDNLNV